jgi:hypothetical protein
MDPNTYEEKKKEVEEKLSSTSVTMTIPKTGPENPRKVDQDISDEDGE